VDLNAEDAEELERGAEGRNCATDGHRFSRMKRQMLPSSVFIRVHPWLINYLGRTLRVLCDLCVNFCSGYVGAALLLIELR
jgi:hypothetical protein